MRRIDTKVHTVLADGRSASRHVNEVAKDKGLYVDRYEQLVDVAAELAYHNWRHTLLFRGQHTDYPQVRARGDPSTIFPSVWRHERTQRKQAYKDLLNKCDCLRQLTSLERRDKRRLRMIPERGWAIMQHYSDVAHCATPLLDVTESIRAAASFATEGYLGTSENSSSNGVVLVLGLPRIQEGTTISVDEGLIILNLASVCPGTARRPHFQSGYLVGTYPTENVGYKPPKDFAHRLIAKLRVSTKSSFWDVDKPLSEPAMFPNDDPLRDEIADACRCDH